MLRYLTHAVELSSTWKLIKPHILDLLTKCVFDLMCFDDEDAELWEGDPQEYIRKVSCTQGTFPRNILLRYLFLSTSDCDSMPKIRFH